MLDIVIMQQCGSVDCMNINGYIQGCLNTEHAFCTCKSFKYGRGKHCKHLKEVFEKKCSYHEQIHGKPDVNGVCPHCGGKTEYVKVGI